MDFSLLLVLATLLTGAIWALDAAIWAPRRRAVVEEGAVSDAPRLPPRQPLVVEYARSFFPVILAVLLLRSFVVEPFRIPSGSMMPTLQVGDFILVNKFAYGLRLPVLHTEILETGRPERGDVAVFRFPVDPSVDYIKRIVGLPGDRIAYRDKVLYINGERLEQKSLGPYRGPGSTGAMRGAYAHEENMGAWAHQILVRPDAPAVDGTVVVPPGHYFAMGDNRDNSNDSRYWGFVSEDDLVGEAFLIWMNWNPQEGGILWRRIGDLVR